MYHNVEIEYIHGRTATLTIYEDGIEVEKVTLSDYKTRDEMHQLFQAKGFVMKSPEEISAISERKYMEEQAEAAHARDVSAKKREEAAARRKQLEEEDKLKKQIKDEIVASYFEEEKKESTKVEL